MLGPLDYLVIAAGVIALVILAGQLFGRNNNDEEE
jgi:hypothetical protein